MVNDRNEEEVNTQINRVVRSDVNKAFPNYSNNTNNQKPGFSTTINTSTYLDGKHNITIKVLDNNEVVKEYSREFYIEKSKSCLHIEKPNNTNMKKTLTISGWLMSTNKDAEIEYYLNDEKVEATITRSKRNDVIKAITGYGNSTTNPTPGFSTSLDLSTYKDGNYKLEVRIIDKNTGEILTRDHRNITLKKYDGRINIEKPNSVEELGTTVVVGGWYLSEYKDSKLEIYLDDTLLENEISRSARPDVLKAISGYGGSSTNPKPGFRMDVDVSDIQDGIHTLKTKIKKPKLLRLC